MRSSELAGDGRSQERQQPLPLPLLPPLVLFDLDDTLFDHRGSSQATLADLAPRWSGLTGVPVDALWQRYHRILEELHPLVLRGALTPEESRTQRAQRLFAELGRTLSVAEAQRFGAEFRERYQQLRFAVAGAQELLEQLRGRTIVAIVTNNLTAEQQDKLRWCRLAHLVDHLVTSEGEGVIKPDPRLFWAALRCAGMAAEDAVVVGDNWDVDIVGAQAAGLRAIWFDREGSHRVLPEQVWRITALDELRRRW